MNELSKAIVKVDLPRITALLKKNPELVNDGIPFDDNNSAKAHPLHRICDGVFMKKYTEDQAMQMVDVFLDHGAEINGLNPVDGKDTPLIAASSLMCDNIALKLIERGANCNHHGTHGGTALHWASWCGRDKLVEKLIDVLDDLDMRCYDFKATPLFWALHSLTEGPASNHNNQIECAILLLDHGADLNIKSGSGTSPREIIETHLTKLAPLRRFI